MAISTESIQSLVAPRQLLGGSKSIRFRLQVIMVMVLLLFITLFSLYLINQVERLQARSALHEAELVVDSIGAGILRWVNEGSIDPIQRYLDDLGQLRDSQDFEVNIIRVEPGKAFSMVVASNNPDNLEETDPEEHDIILEALSSGEALLSIEIEDEGDDEELILAERANLSIQHPDFFFTPANQVVDIVSPLKNIERDDFAINVKLSLKAMDIAMGEARQRLAIFLTLSLIMLVTGIALLLYDQLFRPLRQLADHLRRFGLKQDPGPSRLESRPDELGMLAGEFNRMRQRISDAETLNQRYREHLEEMVIEKTRELNVTQDVTMLSMGALAETRDPETGAHIKRTQNYVRSLAETLRGHPRFRSVLTKQNIEMMYKSAPLHDIGKVGIPDHILLKPGKLSDDEWQVMRDHPHLGSNAIEAAEKQLGSNSFLSYAKEIAACHHEKWDGSGYPLGLEGDSIPVSARLMALADVYDALISKRCYKPAFSHERAVEIIREGRGGHFDPDIVDAFIETQGSFHQIARQFRDEEEPTIEQMAISGQVCAA
jgi:HD-GYP domain-containing protein (c-di-GMP phosphodiesterase class II)